MLEAAVSRLELGAVVTPIKKKLKAEIAFGLSYYNIKVSHWEPIIERFGLDCEYRSGVTLHPRNSILIKTSQGFESTNINISNDMVSQELIYWLS